jgi:prepilin-type N-terminal cleavage/methylation domain-containing protein
MKKIIKAFTLIEMIIVIIILGFLIAALLPKVLRVKEKAYLSTAKSDFRTMDTALQLLLIDNGGVYPADVNRNIPIGLEPYIQMQKLAQRPE